MVITITDRRADHDAGSACGGRNDHDLLEREAARASRDVQDHVIAMSTAAIIAAAASAGTTIAVNHMQQSANDRAAQATHAGNEEQLQFLREQAERDQRNFDSTNDENRREFDVTQQRNLDMWRAGQRQALPYRQQSFAALNQIRAWMGLPPLTEPDWQDGLVDIRSSPGADPRTFGHPSGSSAPPPTTTTSANSTTPPTNVGDLMQQRPSSGPPPTSAGGGGTQQAPLTMPNGIDPRFAAVYQRAGVSPGERGSGPLDWQYYQNDAVNNAHGDVDYVVGRLTEDLARLKSGGSGGSGGGPTANGPTSVADLMPRGTSRADLYGNTAPSSALTAFNGQSSSGSSALPLLDPEDAYTIYNLMRRRQAA